MVFFCQACVHVQYVYLNIHGSIKVEMTLFLYLIETPFNAFSNRADPDQAALVITLFAYGNLIRYDISQGIYMCGLDK